jgi:hypothetical protein
MVKENFRKGKNISVGEVSEDLSGCVQEAADLCPVQIIRVDMQGHSIPCIPGNLQFFLILNRGPGFFGIDQKYTIRFLR